MTYETSNIVEMRKKNKQVFSLLFFSSSSDAFQLFYWKFRETNEDFCFYFQCNYALSIQSNDIHRGFSNTSVGLLFVIYSLNLISFEKSIFFP